MTDLLAYSRAEARKRVPWGRNQFDDDLRDGICESFKIGRRVYITPEMLKRYVERRAEMSQCHD